MTTKIDGRCNGQVGGPAWAITCERRESCARHHPTARGRDVEPLRCIVWKQQYSDFLDPAALPAPAPNPQLDLL